MLKFHKAPKGKRLTLEISSGLNLLNRRAYGLVESIKKYASYLNYQKPEFPILTVSRSVSGDCQITVSCTDQKELIANLDELEKDISDLRETLTEIDKAYDLRNQVKIVNH